MNFQFLQKIKSHTKNITYFFRQIKILGCPKCLQTIEKNQDKQWVQKGQETPSIPKQNPFGKKVMLCIWWNFDGINHFELVPNGRTISAVSNWSRSTKS